MRTYEKTHPWLTFQIDLERLPAAFWIVCGEIQARCDEISHTPLRPELVEKLHHVYLAKGVAATTAIEGNTLTEQEVLQIVEGTMPPLSESREYLKTEVDNVLRACNSIANVATDNNNRVPPLLHASMIKGFNREVLANIPLKPEIIPGEYRTGSYGVPGYRGAPASDCTFLVDHLCQWLNDPSFVESSNPTVTGFLRATIAHLNIAWIHPFGDGNGRTARLIEFTCLLLAGVPKPAAHLLSNHYNLTRSQYYRQLQMASEKQSPYDFLHYSARGFLDGLNEALRDIRDGNLQTVWEHYIFDFFRSSTDLTDSDKRRRNLVLAIARERTPVPDWKIMSLTEDLAHAYTGKTPKTATRDINWLIENKILLRESDKHLRPNYEIVQRMLPRKRG